MTGTKTKICSKCGIEKAFNCFNKNKNNKDGLQTQCKNCRKDFYEQNKEKIASQKKEYYEQNKEKAKECCKKYQKENKEKIKECQKEYREQNKEKIAEKNKDYYEQNKEKIKEYREQNKEKILRTKKEYREQNKEKIKEYMKDYLQTERGKMVRKLLNQKRRTLKKHLPNTLTKEEWAETLEHFNYSCANCGSNETPIHMDHFIPLSSGEKGTTASNCIPLCSRCNCSKGSKHPLDFFSKEKAREIIDYLYTRKSRQPI